MILFFFTTTIGKIQNAIQTKEPQYNGKAETFSTWKTLEQTPGGLEHGHQSPHSPPPLQGWFHIFLTHALG